VALGDQELSVAKNQAGGDINDVHCDCVDVTRDA
jgi:hypothetical protein